MKSVNSHSPPPLPSNGKSTGEDKQTREKFLVKIEQVIGAMLAWTFTNRRWVYLWLILTSSVMVGIIGAGLVLGIGAKLYLDYRLSNWGNERSTPARSVR